MTRFSKMWTLLISAARWHRREWDARHQPHRRQVEWTQVTTFHGCIGRQMDAASDAMIRRWIFRSSDGAAWLTRPPTFSLWRRRRRRDPCVSKWLHLSAVQVCVVFCLGVRFWLDAGVALFLFLFFFSVRAKCPRATPSIDQFRRRHKDLCNKHYSTFWTLTSLITANWVSIFRWHTSAALRLFSQLKSRVTEPICGPTLRRIESDPKEVDESVKRAIEWCVITWNWLKMKRVSVEWSRREFDWFEWMKLCCCVYAQWNWHRFPILRTRAGFAHVSVRHTAEDWGR